MINRFTLSLLSLLIGYLFYEYRYLFSGVIFSSAASFIHVIALTLLSSNFIKDDKHIKYIVILWIGINIVFEYGQQFFNYATFDYLDILAALSAFPFAYLITSYTPKTDILKAWKRPSILLSIAFGSLLIAGSYQEDYYDMCKYELIYQDLDNFREAVEVQEPQDITNISATHIYGHYILLVEKGKGIHIFDQSDINDIKNIQFIKIPGVLHVEVQNDAIFADSLMDLVVIDISDINQIKVKSRLNDVFDYNPWDAVSISEEDQYYFCDYPSYEYKDQGVVVGYKGITQ